jgi:hypothetical protein
MPKQSAPKTVTAFTHTEDKRKNIPSIVLAYGAEKVLPKLF